MSFADAEFARKLAAIRESFDQAFAAPPSKAQDTLVGFLAIRVSGGAYAVRADELADVQASCKVVPLPGGHPDMLGISGVRGRLVPVYSLASLLGLATNKNSGWLAVCKSGLALGLTFDDLEGYVQASPTDVFPIELERSRGHVREVLRQAGATRSVVSASSIVTMLRGALHTNRQGA